MDKQLDKIKKLAETSLLSLQLNEIACFLESAEYSIETIKMEEHMERSNILQQKHHEEYIITILSDLNATQKIPSNRSENDLTIENIENLWSEEKNLMISQIEKLRNRIIRIKSAPPLS